MKTKKEPKITFERYDRVLEVWIAIHRQEQHFSDNTIPRIKTDHANKIIRANDLFTKLPENIKEVLVAHELGHLNRHQDLPIANPFYRLGCVMDNKVDPKELEADQYAISLIGYKKFMIGMTKILEMWQNEPDKHSKSAIKELQLRIEHFKKLN